ncbi:GntR family transcriptional regulator [Salisediminibacterium halotolerans]|uniref:DNA-binding transcriptional regulator YhcF, GntR family n=1 Tax=Salisediminibacterium halotolerans TaxID=517425 RepID=A0A1H9WV96_9BACI|nr:GntR family transcriptional regulator [Salisediminibacterium haloalkalitolerans]SES37343.1 DNA-binding transcriptional regulator YhcF, GntR family [Salisediminibacterium haloalkalitolerans]
MTMTFNDHQPIYQQLMAHLSQRICRGDLAPGEKLPSVRILAADVGVNPNTVSRTYMELEREKIVESKRGQGTFVTEELPIIEELRRSQAWQQTQQFKDNMEQLGIDQATALNLLEQAWNNKGGPS